MIKLANIFRKTSKINDIKDKIEIRKKEAIKSNLALLNEKKKLKDQAKRRRIMNGVVSQSDALNILEK